MNQESFRNMKQSFGSDMVTFQSLSNYPSETNSPIICLDQVSFGYSPQSLVLKNINLDINQGEFLTLLGPSGCGKSTVLNLIAGFENPNSGTITHDGELIKGPSVERGVVFQGNALFDWMNVEQNVSFGFRFQALPKHIKNRRTQSIIELVGLRGNEKKYPYQLSGGMRQRVAVARSMVTHPQILLMDEPFAAVDVQTREDLQEELLKLHENIQGAILFVTHSIEEAVFLSNRIIILSRDMGKIHHEIEIDLPSPRYSSMNRVSEEFNNYRRQIYIKMKEIL